MEEHKKYKNVVCRIEMEDEQGNKYIDTGFLFGNGWVMTEAHKTALNKTKVFITLSEMQDIMLPVTFKLPINRLQRTCFQFRREWRSHRRGMMQILKQSFCFREAGSSV